MTVLTTSGILSESDFGWQCEVLQVLMSEGPFSIIWSVFNVSAEKRLSLPID